MVRFYKPAFFANLEAHLINVLLSFILGQLDNASKTLDKEQLLAIHNNRVMLHSLSRYLVRSSVPEEVAQTILKCLSPMADHALSPTSEGLGFDDLMGVMNTLAGETFVSTIPEFHFCQF